MKRCCVFCGSNSGRGDTYRVAAREVGSSLASLGVGVVYGGGNVGLMGELADAVIQQGGEVIGVIPRSLAERELAHDRLAGLEVVDSMHARKARMAELADAFVALPGGYGTFEEFFEVVTWRQLGFIKKPCGLLNIAGYFDPLLSQIDRAIDEGFIRPEHRQYIHESDDFQTLWAQMAQSSDPTPGKWIDN